MSPETTTRKQALVPPPVQAPAQPILQPLTEALLARRSELQALLRQGGTLETSIRDQPQGEVTDFKDLAMRQTDADLDDMQAGLALRELQDISAALARVRNNSYGLCIDCGETIDARRLCALPATACCVACQARHEQASAAAPTSYRFSQRKEAS